MVTLCLKRPAHPAAAPPNSGGGPVPLRGSNLTLDAGQLALLGRLRDPAKYSIGRPEGGCTLAVPPAVRAQQFAAVRAGLAGPWRDPEQPPALGPDDVFLDPSAVTGAPSTLFVQLPREASAISVNDLDQGQIADCWLVSALSLGVTMGRVPSLFRRVDPAKGVYEVQLWGSGEDGLCTCPVTVCVDGALPFFGEIVPGTPYTSRIRSRGVASTAPTELWAGLVEKALAKVAVRGAERGYPALQGGSTSLGLALLFGGRASELTVTSSEYGAADLAADLAALAARGHQCGVAWRPGSPAGLVPGHAFAVLRFETVLLPDGAPVSLLQLRNPWGVQRATLDQLCQGEGGPAATGSNFEWRGDWSDCSPLWGRYPGVAAALAYEPAAQVDGIFWISVADAAAYLLTIEVWESLESLQYPIACESAQIERLFRGR